jgi:hypothetical protein
MNMLPAFAPLTDLTMYGSLVPGPASHFPLLAQKKPPVTVVGTSLASDNAVEPIAPPVNDRVASDALATQLPAIPQLFRSTTVSDVVKSFPLFRDVWNSEPLGRVKVITLLQVVQFVHVSPVTLPKIRSVSDTSAKIVAVPSHSTAKSPNRTAFVDSATIVTSLPHKFPDLHKFSWTLQSTVFLTLAEAELAPMNAVAAIAAIAARLINLMSLTVSPSVVPERLAPEDDLRATVYCELRVPAPRDPS